MVDKGIKHPKVGPAFGPDHRAEFAKKRINNFNIININNVTSLWHLGRPSLITIQSQAQFSYFGGPAR